MMNELTQEKYDNCKNCKGSGKQVFHGAFSSGMGVCNFCKGSGKLSDFKKCFGNKEGNEKSHLTDEEKRFGFDGK